MTRIALTSDAVITDAATFTTASIVVPADARIIVFVASAAQGILPVTPNAPTISGLNLAFAQLNSVTVDGLDRRRLTAFAATSVAGTGSLTISFGNQRQDLCAWSMIAYTGVTTTGPLASFTGTATGTTLTVDTPVTGDGLTIVAGLALPTFTLVTPRGGADEVHEAGNQQLGNRAITLETEDRDSAAPSMSWGWASNAAAVGIAVALPAVASTPTGPPPVTPSVAERLALRFAPVLHLHPAERFVPVDAKRYVEHCAVWQAITPFDTTETWGGRPGDPYPRQPLAKEGSVSALVGEPGAPLNDTELGSVGTEEDKFLQFSGWTDGTGTTSVTVDADSVTTYSDVEAIAARYGEDAALAASANWYHAEYIDPLTLSARAASDPRKLDRVLGSHSSNAGLLCYYLFYPHHAESAGQDSGDCSGSIAAQQVLSHSGDWHCVAVLIDDPEDDAAATPRFIGMTTTRLGADDGGAVPPAYSGGSAGSVTMVVRQWRPSSGPAAGLPKLVDGHPRLYVAAGSHGMYPTPGEQVPLNPSAGTAFCGRFDPHQPVPSGLVPHREDGDPGEDMLAFFAKLLGGMGIGGALGGVLGPIGVAAGVIAAAAEGVLPHAYGLDLVGYGDPVDTDKAPEVGESTALAPPGVTVSGVADSKVWASQQGLHIDGRRYDLVVDRTTQRYWPPAPGEESGFRGRWGQRVTSDAGGYRSGPYMPDFIAMFLDAMADGDNRGLFGG